jgi:hypothetical protein
MISPPFDKKKAKDPVTGLEQRLCPAVERASRRFCCDFWERQRYGISGSIAR